MVENTGQMDMDGRTLTIPMSPPDFIGGDNKHAKQDWCEFSGKLLMK